MTSRLQCVPPGEYHLILVTSVATAQSCPQPFESTKAIRLHPIPNASEQQSSVHRIGFVQSVGKLWKCIDCVFGSRKSHLATAASSGGGRTMVSIRRLCFE